jgi:hypothetical protein
MRAPSVGASRVTSHSTSCSTALTTKMSGTKVDGGILLRHLALIATSTSDTIEVAITIDGNEVMSRCARYSASRAALAAMNCAVTTAAQNIVAPSGGAVGCVGLTRVSRRPPTTGRCCRRSE